MQLTIHTHTHCTSKSASEDQLSQWRGQHADRFVLKTRERQRRGEGGGVFGIVWGRGVQTAVTPDPGDSTSVRSGLCLTALELGRACLFLLLFLSSHSLYPVVGT